MSYYPLNIIQATRNVRAGLPPTSLQVRALAYLAGAPANARTVTQRDANRYGFAVQGLPLFVASWSRTGHENFAVSMLSQFEKNAESSRIARGLTRWEFFDVQAAFSRVARINAKHPVLVAKGGELAQALCALLPEADCLALAIEAHKERGNAVNIAWQVAANYVRINRLVHI